MKNLFILLFFFSCASSYQNDYPDYVLSKRQSRDVHSLAVLFKVNNFNMVVNNVILDKSNEDYIEQKGIAFSALEEEVEEVSSLKFIGESGNKADLYIHFDIDRRFSSNQFWKYFTPFTLYILPRRTEEKIRVSVRYYDRHLNLIGMTEHNDSLIRWMHLSLVLLYPFSDSYNQAFASLMKSIFRESLSEAYQKKYF